MKKTNKIHELRKNGYKVKVTIYRYYPHDREIYPIYQIKKWAGMKNVCPHGGKNVIHLKSPDGREVMGVAECSKEEQYNRKIGNSIALGRALKQLDSVPVLV
jgi:hypothetical protein